MRYSRMNNISGKLRRTFLGVMIAALLVSNVTIFLIMRNAYGKALLNNYRSIGENISAQIDNRLSLIIKLGQTICTDSKLRNMVVDIRGQEGYRYYSGERKISSLLNGYAMMYDNLVDDIYFVTGDDAVISRNGYYQNTTAEDWFLGFLDQKAHFGFTGTHEAVNGANVSERKEVVTYIAGMFSMEGTNDANHFMGWVIINIRTEELFRDAEEFQDVEYAVCTAEGNFVHGSESLAGTDGEPAAEEKHAANGKGYQIYKTNLSSCGWLFLMKVSSYAVTRSLMLIGVLAFLILGVTITGTALIVRYYSLMITEPLGQLTECMTRFAAGDFQAYAKIASGDEVEKIADVYNNMIDNIRLQMDENVSKEKEKKESEIRFLMAQIKPHFIYNCLNCIIYLARQGKDADVIKFTRAFISVLQSSIKKKPRELVPLLSEVEYIKDYLTLVAFRYGYLPDFRWEIDKNCQNCSIPAMILQPIVENCVFHGFDDLEDKGRIELCVSPENSRIKIAVRDNGCGMNREEVEHLLEVINKNTMLPEWSEHIGLFNVNERLRLCYGEDSGLHIESEPGKGTLVWFYGEKMEAG